MTKDELKIKFLSELASLSVRSRNILKFLQVDSFETFYETYVLHNKRIDFRKISRCGLRSEIELNRFIIEVLKDTQELVPLNKKPTFYNDIRMEFIFKTLLNDLTIRSINVLTKGDANTFKGFYDRIVNSDCTDRFLINIRNCGKKSLNEILELKQKVIEVINDRYGDNSFLDICPNDDDNDSHQGIFTYLRFQLFYEQIFNEKEVYILRHYYCLEKGFLKKTFAEIGSDLGLTRERVRQISVKLINKLKKNIRKAVLKQDKGIEKYYQGVCFRIDEDITNQINNIEQTNFTIKFLTYALYVLCPEHYQYVDTKKEKKEQIGFDGVFVKNTISINVRALYKYLLKLADDKRNEDKELTVKELIKLFPNKAHTEPNKVFCDDLPSSEIDLIKETIRLLLKNYICEENGIEITSTQIIFKRNTKKMKYEYLVDILREYRRPLHYSDIEKECKKRGFVIESVQGHLVNHCKIFGLKGPGTYGLKEWGGYFGSIGDVTETILRERNKPIHITELEDVLCRELYISQDSIRTVLFNYDIEHRFVKNKNNYVALQEWKNY